MKRKTLLLIGMACIAAGIVFYGVVIEPNRLEINHIRIENPSSNKSLEGRIAVHLSDFHMGAPGEMEARILKQIDAIQPDFIFLTGDYVQWKGDYEPPLDFLSKLNARVGVWAVMGDYDYSISRKSCLFCHPPGSGERTRRHSVKFLRNTIEKIDMEHGSIWIAGLDPEDDEVNLSNTRDSLLEIEEFVIVLSHDPLEFELLDPNRETLMLSGDTHGGQIPLPSWLWKILGYRKCALYERGLFKRGRNTMYVSKGVGASHLPIRILRRPEMTIFHF